MSFTCQNVAKYENIRYFFGNLLTKTDKKLIIKRVVAQMKWYSNKALKSISILLYTSITLALCSYFAFYAISGIYSFYGFYKNVGRVTLISFALLFALLFIFDVMSYDLRRVSINELFKFAIILLILFAFSLFYKLLFLKNVKYTWCLFVYVSYSVLFLSGFYFKRIIVYFLFLKDKHTATRTLIVGAGGACNILLKEIFSTDKISINPVCIVDDDPEKKGMRIEGVKVVGNTDELIKIVEKYSVQMILIAIPSLPKKQLAGIYEKCVATKIPVKQVPGLYQFLSGKATLSDIKEIDLRDLLGREQIVCDVEKVALYVENKVVLVTGGGGSIGSELCRQLAVVNPKRLIIFDVNENGVYVLQQELRKKFPSLSFTILIGSVRDKGRLRDIFKNYKPQIVFHAAAHKHVPLMEDSPNEAVKNNVLGTYNVASVSDEFGVERFLLISTDKAVNPTNVMGASKRICEMIIQTFAKKSKTEFVAVRFGNVLGSSGSVIPLFKKQIAQGGPVTVTSKEITRYFMTIPEAVSLVLQAGGYAHGGEIFVLDMGEPVKIYDMAEKLIRLSGFEPNKDIAIKICGLRPGEKLYEERLMDEEGLQKTENELISIGKPLVFDEKEFMKNLEVLIKEAYQEDGDIKHEIAKIVTTYDVYENEIK